ncbi:hypothetical protein BPOR_0006g00490 [Botrytis porri]|uniref:C2H2-type domain-containing protein n=1 Tax=Botrytis porri TaxID=87229 RepID=A0A4Z1L675_9HELO|nr:hypothetical protein BPOR_0006g00490 [Botrytis porri]
MLELILKAFPTPYTEISWMEVESQLSDIVQTTCVPFLCVLDMKDLMEYLNDRQLDRAKIARYLATLAKFLIRLSKLMGDSIPATVDPLILSCLEYLKEWPGVKSLYLGHAIVHEQLESLDHYGIKYLNGIIGLGLASILTSEESPHRYKYNRQVDWHPFGKSFAYSTIELLTQAELYGAISLAKLKGVVYDDLPLTTRVLIAFGQVKLESYDNARDMLGPILDEVKGIYGSQSMEVFLIGATLVNCLNRCRMESLAEGLVNSIFRKAVGQLEMSTTTQEFLIGLSTKSNYYIDSELSMVVAFADSLLGQGKHDDAISLFQGILKRGRPGREDITMSVALRISKIIRRLNTKSSINDVQTLERSDAWRVLRDVLDFYPRVSSILKYAYVEEVICHLSLLEDGDTRQRFVASEIIKVLNLEPIPYKGSERLTAAVELAASLRKKLLEERRQRLPIYETRARSQRPNKSQETSDKSETDCAPTVKRSSGYQDSNQETPLPLRTKKVKATPSVSCHLCNRANTILRIVGPDGEEVYCTWCEPRNALGTGSYPNTQAGTSDPGSSSNLWPSHMRPMDQHDLLMIGDSTNCRRESISQSHPPHVATQPQSIVQYVPASFATYHGTTYQYAPKLTDGINSLMGAGQAPNWKPSPPIPKVSNENTDRRVNSLASMKTGGNEPLDTSIKPTLASSYLPGQSETHQKQPQSMKLDDILPEQRPKKCPHPACGKFYINYRALQAHYYMAHEQCHICAACNARFGTEAEIRQHCCVIQPGEKKRFTCMVPDCASRSRDFNRKSRLEEHMKKWHGSYCCSAVSCPRGLGHGFKDQTLLNDHLIKAHAQESHFRR